MKNSQHFLSVIVPVYQQEKTIVKNLSQIKNVLDKIRYPHEIIAVVDDQDKVISQVARKNHANGRLHRETAILLKNKNNEILIQIREDDKTLDYSVLGHFHVDETYKQGAVREAREELGIEIEESDLVEIKKFRVDTGKGKYVNRRFTTLFEFTTDYKLEDFNIDKNEVKAIAYYSSSSLKKIIKNNPEKMSEGLKNALKIYFKKRRL